MTSGCMVNGCVSGFPVFPPHEELHRGCIMITSLHSQLAKGKIISESFRIPQLGWSPHPLIVIECGVYRNFI